LIATGRPARVRRSTLPRRSRLLSGNEFRHVLRTRRAESNRLFRIHWRRRESDAEPRLGLAIARRVARRAVDRNRIKRCARETYRLRRDRLPAMDFVVMAKPPAVGADTGELARALDQLWLRFESQ